MLQSLEQSVNHCILISAQYISIICHGGLRTSLWRWVLVKKKRSQGCILVKYKDTPILNQMDKRRTFRVSKQN